MLGTNLDDQGLLEEQLRGCQAAFYLVHSMESAGRGYAARDRAMAHQFAEAAERAGVERIVFLGGLGNADDQLSDHLASRREVEDVLRSNSVPVTVFRAAMIIGSGSASFEILRYLTERLPIMVTPRWVRTECQPISVRNVLHYLVECLAVPETVGRILEIGGADIVTYESLLQTMAAARGLPRRYVIPVPLLTPHLSALWIHLVTPVSARMALPLAEGLRNRVVVTNDDAAHLMPQILLSARESIAIALEAEAHADVESTWSSAGPVPGDPDWAGGKVFTDTRTAVVNAAPNEVFAVLQRLGGKEGWFRYNNLWRARGILDRFLGGPGWKRQRRHPEQLSWGETVGFWRVSELDRDRRLTLRAEMRVPGDAVLDFEISPMADGMTLLTQSARFRPRGLAGLLYWYSIVPFHAPVFEGLFRGIRDSAERHLYQLPALQAPEATRQESAPHIRSATVQVTHD